MNLGGPSITSWFLGLLGVLVAGAVVFLFANLREHDGSIRTLQVEVLELRRDYQAGPSNMADEMARWAKQDEQVKRNRERIINLETRVGELETHLFKRKGS